MTGFTPELVERVSRVLFDRALNISHDDCDRLAIKALEASGIAELTEALRHAVGLLKDARLLGAESPTLNAFNTLLAKIGGNHG